MFTPHNDIDQVIESLSKGISDISGENLVGIYLFGSLTYGDFNYERSDIDVVTILKSPASKSELEELEKLHQKIGEQFPLWKDRIENSFTPQTLLENIEPPGDRPYFGAGTFYPLATYGNEWIINNYLLYHHGIAIKGPEFKELVKPIDIHDVQKACVKDLFKEWEPKLREPEWLDNPHYQSYLVLNLCRILNTVSNATVLSKKKSAEWVKDKFPEWKNLIDEAERWQYGKEMKRKEETLNFLRFVITQKPSK